VARLRLDACLTFTLTLSKISTVTTSAEAKPDRTWTVGELAEDLGVTTRTLRFYEAEGLLSPRRVGTSRIYSPRDRARLRLILRGKRFGMSLADIREIVDMYDGAASSERRQLAMLLARLDDIAVDLRARQSDLQRTLDEVADVAARCRVRLTELDG
jgi:DNA-binding transcriptional MerR regulator